MKAEIKKIEGLPLKYKGFTIRQDTKSLPVKHPFNPCLDCDKIVLLSHLCISKDLEDPVYNDDFTQKKSLLGGFGLSDRKFKTVSSAKKEIDSILSLGYCWMALTPRETKYVKENLHLLKQNLDLIKII